MSPLKNIIIPNVSTNIDRFDKIKKLFAKRGINLGCIIFPPTKIEICIMIIILIMESAMLIQM